MSVRSSGTASQVVKKEWEAKVTVKRRGSLTKMREATDRTDRGEPHMVDGAESCSPEMVKWQRHMDGGEDDVLDLGD